MHVALCFPLQAITAARTPYPTLVLLAFSANQPLFSVQVGPDPMHNRTCTLALLTHSPQALRLVNQH